jgi:hypothetical protein
MSGADTPMNVEDAAKELENGENPIKAGNVVQTVSAVGGRRKKRRKTRKSRKTERRRRRTFRRHRK